MASSTVSRAGSQADPATALSVLDGAAARRWAVLSRALLAARRREIDALNVFPVPDADTGTNLYLTFDAALDAVRRQPEQADQPDFLTTASRALADAMLLCARGNSGVILSQVVRGMADVAAERNAGLDASALAQALQRASERAAAAVSRPMAGTMLTVAAVTADAALAAARDGSSLYAVSAAALVAARSALADTTGQLDVLRRAGVVDAGAAGYVVLVEALESVCGGQPVVDRALAPLPPEERTAAEPAWASPSNAARSHQPLPDDQSAGGSGAGGGSAYEVMFLLSDSSDEAVDRMRAELDAMGDSVLVVGGPDLWNVHVHVADAGAALEAGVAAGRPHRIRVTFLGASPRGPQHPALAPTVVAFAEGRGLAEVFRLAGAAVVDRPPGRRPSSGDILLAVLEARSPSVLLLPADPEIHLAADAVVRAAAERGVELHVVRARSAVKAVAAMAVFDPDASAHDNLLVMTGAAAATRQGAVTVARQEALTSAGWCRPGDVLGVVDGEIVAIGTDAEPLADVAAQVALRLLGSGGELLTVLAGADAPDGLGRAVAREVRRRRRDVETTVLDGGQPRDLLLLGVE